MHQNSFDFNSEQTSLNTLQHYLLLDSFDDKSKESTRQQKYDDLCRYKTQLRRQNHNLKRQLQQTKQQILSKALGLYFQQIQELSEYNQTLREKHRKIAETKKPKVQNISYNSAMHTPRSRKSIINIYEPQRNGPQTERSPHQQKQETYGRKSLNFKNDENVDPKFFSRNSLKFSDMRKNTNSQMTQRKKATNILNMSDMNNFSLYSQCNSRQGSLRGSVQGKKQRKQEKQKIQNIFNLFVNSLLKEEQIKHTEIEEMINENNPRRKIAHESVEVEEIERQIMKSSENIEQMEEMLGNFEREIKQMQLNIECVSSMTRDIVKIKNSFFMMRQKCRNIHLLRKQVSVKTHRLQELKACYSHSQSTFQAPYSIKILLRVFGIEEEETKDPQSCKKQLKGIVKGKLEKPIKRKMKVKEMLDSIKEGRKKFKELMTVYTARISKIQKKIQGLKFQERKS